MKMKKNGRIVVADLKGAGEPAPIPPPWVTDQRRLGTPDK